MRGTAEQNYRLPLETFFSACLNAARSCYFILMRTGGPGFKPIEARWRNKDLDQDGRARFWAMVHLRDRDVHFGEIPAETLPKMIEVDGGGSPYGHHYNAVLFGPRPRTEHKNPDGVVVSGEHGLQGTVGLYIDLNGAKAEASTACVGFIEQLHSLLRAAEAATKGDSTDHHGDS